MDKKQKNKLKMFKNTQLYLDENTEKWDKIPRIVNYKNKLDGILLGIGKKNTEAAGVIGIGNLKDKVKEFVAKKASTLSGPLQALASEDDDADLLKAVKYSKTEIIRLNDVDVEGCMKNLCTVARKYIDLLPEFGQSEANIVELETTVDDFVGLIGKPRASRNKAFVVKDSVETLIDDCNEMLRKRMDKVMIIFRDTDEEFYNGYLRARTIVDN